MLIMVNYTKAATAFTAEERVGNGPPCDPGDPQCAGGFLCGAFGRLCPGGGRLHVGEGLRAVTDLSMSSRWR